MSLAVTNRASISASEAEDMTNLIIWEMVRMVSFYRGFGSSSERNMCAPVRNISLETLRYSASEWADRLMLLFLWVIPSFWYVTT